MLLLRPRTHTRSLLRVRMRMRSPRPTRSDVQSRTRTCTCMRTNPQLSMSSSPNPNPNSNPEGCSQERASQALHSSPRRCVRRRSRQTQTRLQRKLTLTLAMRAHVCAHRRPGLMLRHPQPRQRPLRPRLRRSSTLRLQRSPCGLQVPRRPCLCLSGITQVPS